MLLPLRASPEGRGQGEALILQRNSSLCSRYPSHYSCRMKISQCLRKNAAEQGIAKEEAFKSDAVRS
jgi:hypothetical protein